MIGGGGYTVPKVLLKEPGVESVDIAEIEPALFELGKKYFNVPEDSRLKNHIVDGRRFLFENEKPYDFIFSDVYFSFFSLPVHFTTEEFFKLAKKNLNQNGVFMANLIGKLDNKSPSFIMSEIKTFKAAFPNSYFFAVRSPELSRGQNIIFVGLNNDQKIDFSDKAISENPDQIISRSGSHLVDLNRIDFSLYDKLTDNFAPVEYLASKILNWYGCKTILQWNLDIFC